MDSACEEASGEVAQVVCGGFQIAELELEAAEDTDRLDREDLVRDILRKRQDLVGGGTRLLDETEVGFEERLRTSHPVTSVSVLRLLRQLVRRTGMLDREAPAAGEPLERGQRPEHHHAADLVPA